MNAQKGFIPLPLITLILIIAGIIFGSLMISDRLSFSPKASQNEIKSSYEYAYNPFGDPWATKKPANPALSVGLTVPCYRYGPRAVSDPTSLDEEIEFLAKSNTSIIFEECATISDVNSAEHGQSLRARIKDLAAKLKIRRPDIKYIGYYAFSDPDDIQAGYKEIAEKANSSDPAVAAEFEQFFMHIKNKPKTKENRIYLISNGDCSQKREKAVLDITNDAYQQYIVPKVAEAMNDLNLGGVLSDSVSAAPLTGILCDSEVPDETKTNWAYAMKLLHQRLKSALGPDKLLFVNVSMDNGFYKDMVDSGRADGIMLEDPIGRLFKVNERVSEPEPFAPGFDRYQKLKNILEYMHGIDKYVLINVNTNVNQTVYELPAPPNPNLTVTNSDWEKTFANYYYAAYLNIFMSPKQILFYENPSKAGDAFRSAAFYKIWDLDLGLPTGNSEQVSEGVFVRKFQRGYVYYNSMLNNRYQIPGGTGLFSVDGSETEINRGVVRPKTGALFVTSDLIRSYNENTITPTPIPTPSTSPVPVTTEKPDIVGDRTQTTSPAMLTPYVEGGANLNNKSGAYCNGKVSRIHLEWDVPPGDLGSKIFRSTDAPGSGIKLGETSGFGWNDETVIPGTRYHYSIGVITRDGDKPGNNFSATALSCP